MPLDQLVTLQPLLGLLPIDKPKEEFAQTLHDKTTDEQECSADFAELLRGVLSCEWLYGLKAFSNIILDMDVARFWFTEKQHQHFRAILVSEFPKFQQEMVRMLALVYLRNTVPSEQIGDVFLEMWKAQISLLAPVGGNSLGIAPHVAPRRN